LLGKHHPVTSHVQRVRTSLNRHMQRLEHGSVPLLPALVLRYFQRKVAFWAEEQSTLDAYHPYTARDIISDMASGDTSWQICLPSAYLRELPPAPAPFPHLPAPLAPPRLTQAPTPPVAPALSPAPALAAQSVVRREGGPDPRFSSIAARNIAARVPKEKIRRGDFPPPLDSHGRQRCLAWTCKGLCNTRCAQAHDHRMDHTEDEQANLLAWCTEHWV
jgi:hypothetical protein